MDPTVSQHALYAESAEDVHEDLQDCGLQLKTCAVIAVGKCWWRCSCCWWWWCRYWLLVLVLVLVVCGALCWWCWC